ncbi:MAG: RING finger protein [Anaerolineales bacterium]
MAVRNSTMSYNSNQTSGQWHLLRKLVLLLLLVVALALGLVLAFRQKSDFPLLLFNVLADVSLGVIAGLGSRFVLRQRNWVIQVLASTATVFIGLYVLGAFTNWKSGVGPLPFSLNLGNVNWLDPFHIAWGSLLRFKTGRVNMIGLAQMVIAVDTSWIALRAWRQSGLVERSVGSTPRVGNHGRLRSSPVAVSPNTAFPKIRLPRGLRSGFKSKPMIKPRKLDRPVIASAAMPAPGRSSRSKRWNPLRRKPEIQFAAYEEYRCPYCFEVVKRDDPRGVVECDVCHTLHHKDCWDITGTCQVPHLNT